MTESTARPIKELRLLLMLTSPEQASSIYFAEFIFPLLIFEDNQRVALLIPEPAAQHLVINWQEMLPRLEKDSAIIDVPYHPAIEEDPSIYGFSVFVAYKGADEIAMAEMLMVQQYAPRLWKLYHHLARPFPTGSKETE